MRMHLLLLLLLHASIAMGAERLTLIDEGELMKYVNGFSSWNIVIQNPYSGLVELVESPMDKLQLLINTTTTPGEESEDVGYSLRSEENNLFIKLEKKALPVSETDWEDDIFYVHVLCIIVAGLIKFSFFCSIIFICWWNKNKRPLDKMNPEPDGTKMPLLSSEPTTPYLFHQFQPGTNIPIQENGISDNQVKNTQSLPGQYLHHDFSQHQHSFEDNCSTAEYRDFQPQPVYALSVAHGGSTASPSDAGMDMTFHGHAGSSISSGSTKEASTLGTQASTLNRPRHIARDFLDNHVIERAVGANTQGGQSPPRSGHRQLHGALVVGTTCHREGFPLPGMVTGQGSDETSGILSDSDASTMEKQSNSTAASLIGGATICPPERYVSLDANDQRYVPLGMVAEVAACPQHSYLVNPVMQHHKQMAQQHLPVVIETKPLLTSHPQPVHTSLAQSTAASTQPSSQISYCAFHGSGLNSDTMSSASSVQTVMGAEEFHLRTALANCGNGDEPIKAASLGRPMGRMSMNKMTDGLGNKITPNPPKRSVSLTPNEDNIKCLDIGTNDLPPPDDIDQDTLSEIASSDELPPDHPNYATSPRSALKGSRPGPPVTKQLRFTTLTLVTLCAILAPTTAISLRSKPPSPHVTLTLYLPKRLMPAKPAGIDLITLYFNASSNTQVKLNGFDRSKIHIYDVPNSYMHTSSRVCQDRYACSHTCFPGEGFRCVCRRGFREVPGNDKLCEDIDECASGVASSSPAVSQARTPYPGEAERAKCVRQGGTCVNTPGNFSCVCPVSNVPLHPQFGCSDCSAKCAPGHFTSTKCSAEQSIKCESCRPLCISNEFEFSSCTQNTNRICEPLTALPGIEIPYKQNVWFEDLRNVRDVSTGPLDKMPDNKEIILNRGSGYQVKLKFTDLNLTPIMEPVDHSKNNDNSLFRPSRLNTTLRELCPYPMPKYYTIKLEPYAHVTSDAVRDPHLPGYRPSLSPCRTYTQHGNFPPLRGNAGEGLVSCVEAARLPGLFGERWNRQLIKATGKYYDQKKYCSQMRTECQRCLSRCSTELIDNSLVCKPTKFPEDNGRSPRLGICFDCCVQDNCTNVCDKYANNRCSPHVCMEGARLDFRLQPEWPLENGRFLCHVQPRRSQPIYQVSWTVLKDNKPLTREVYQARLNAPANSTAWQETFHSQFGPGGVLRASYTTGLRHLPEVVDGTNVAVKGYQWNKQASIPLTPRFDDVSAIHVFPHQPMSVNTGVWSHVTASDCSKADSLLDQLSPYQPSSYDPIKPLKSDVDVSRTGTYQYQVLQQNIKPQVNFTIPRSASLLGTVFLPVQVGRGSYLKAGLALHPGVSSLSTKAKANWVVEVTGVVTEFPGLFRLQLWPMEGDNTVESPTASPLLDYEVGVFEEKRFQVRLLVPAPNEEPQQPKEFLVRILDTAGTLDIKVRREVQPPKSSQLLRKFQRNAEGSDAEIFPDISPSKSQQFQERKGFDDALAIRHVIFWPVVGAFAFATLLLFLGHLTRRESDIQPDNSFHTRHLIFFLIFMLFKFIYIFSHTLTCLLIVTRVFTREPAAQISLYSDFSSNISVLEQLYLDQMDVHLDRELTNQFKQVDSIKAKCDNKIKELYDNLEKRIESISESSADRWSRVLVSQAALESAKEGVEKAGRDLKASLGRYNATVPGEMEGLSDKMMSTRARLEDNSWMMGARAIYDKVQALRQSGGSTEDADKNFLEWARIGAELNTVPPILTLPTNHPSPDTSKLSVNLPPVQPQDPTDSQYGPAYVPYTPDSRVLELDQASWTIVDNPSDTTQSGEDPAYAFSWLRNAEQAIDQLAKEEAGGKSSEYGGGEEEFVVTWMHMLGLALTLDALWLVHRLAHTFDTAQTILYGSPNFIDCTSQATKRRLREGTGCFSSSLKKTFVTAMQSDCIPRLCGSIFALLTIFLLSQHLNEAISEDSLHYIGFYDNLVLPVHLRYRLVNTQLAQSAQRLNDQEMAHYERGVNNRYREAQFILNKYSEWTRSIEEGQCKIFMQYKINPNGIPLHCKLSSKARIEEIEAERKLDWPGCQLEVINTNLFTGYNESTYYRSLVESSRDWIKAVRVWTHRVLLCLFIYVSVMIGFNTFSSLLWLILKRFHLLREKRMYETDCY